MRVGFDIGGTFTDVTAIDEEGQTHVTKVLSVMATVGDDISRYVRGVQGARPVN
ncbi:MAG: hypothetical protein HOI95_03030, partial [Chromatiales bacterium]|nr:hypothetical protein [Chromatiales bacterium]